MGEEELLCVTGSVYLAGAALGALREMGFASP